MKKILSKISFARFLVIMGLIVVSSTFNACKEDYFERFKPSWLGESLYNQLQQGYKDDNGVNHTFKTFQRLVDDIGYTEVLQRTGSKTIFAADDEAFNRFYQNNNWGVKSYEGFTLAQKKLIMNSSMINNAYLIEMLSSTEGTLIDGPNQGQAMRRNTAVNVVDSICFETKENLPYNKFFDVHRENGYRLAKDNTPIPMVHFLQRQMDYKGITDADFQFIFKGITRQKNDAFIYGNKVIVQDITCKNGYMNILQDVLVPPANMAEVIRTNPKTKVFSRILDRFSAPFYDASLTSEFKRLNPSYTDSVFVKRYFTVASPLNPWKQTEAGLLVYDPGRNGYYPAGTTGMGLQTDMGAIFVPSDDVLTTFFATGGGKFMTEKYGSVDNIPNDKLAYLMNNLMKPSFLGAVPHRFPEVLDDGQEPMGISTSDVDTCLMANNGVVYVTNKVYSPAFYAAVTAPTVVNDNLKVFTWAVADRKFDAYLLSMDSRYSYMVPVDDNSNSTNLIKGKGMYYVDPVSLYKYQKGALNAEMIKFTYNTKTKTVNAAVYKYFPATGEVGDSLRVLTASQIQDRMEDMLDNHIVVGNIEDGKGYYRTKNGAEIYATGGSTISAIQGSGNIEFAPTENTAVPEDQKTYAALVPETKPTVSHVYDQTKETNGRGNGKTYIISSPLSPATKSVTMVLASDTTNFGEFYKLLSGGISSPTPDQIKKYQILDGNGNVKFFNTFHYTVYVPTNTAIRGAIAQGLPTWDVVNAQTDADVKDSLAALLVNFLRYHFQDNSVYIDGTATDIKPYETAASYSTTQPDGSIIKSYYKLYTKLTPTGLTLASNAADISSARAVNVTNNKGVVYPVLNNIRAREYIFKGTKPEDYEIETSSHVVIHQVDNVLLYKSDQLTKMKQLVRRYAPKNKTTYKKVQLKK